MMEGGPCGPTQTWLHVFIVLVNAIQAMGIAYIAHRAARKNREERNGSGHKTE